MCEIYCTWVVVKLLKTRIAPGMVGTSLASVGTVNTDPVGIVIVGSNRARGVALIFIEIFA